MIAALWGFRCPFRGRLALTFAVESSVHPGVSAHRPAIRGSEAAGKAGALMAGRVIRETVTLAGRADRARLARAFVEGALGPGHPCGDVAALLASELFSNSLRYSGSGAPGETVTVAVKTAISGVIRVEVTDRSGPGGARAAVCWRRRGRRAGASFGCLPCAAVGVAEARRPDRDMVRASGPLLRSPVGGCLEIYLTCIQTRRACQGCVLRRRSRRWLPGQVHRRYTAGQSQVHRRPIWGSRQVHGRGPARPGCCRAARPRAGHGPGCRDRGRTGVMRVRGRSAFPLLRGCGGRSCSFPRWSFARRCARCCQCRG